VAIAHEADYDHLPRRGCAISIRGEFSSCSVRKE